MTAPKKKKVPIPVTVEQEEDAPVETTDTTLGGSNGFNWNVAMKLLQPVLLALIGLATVYFGRSASNAAVEAKYTAAETQVKVEKVDSARTEQIEVLQETAESTHSLVNSQKTELERQNAVLRLVLKRAGIDIPEGTKARDTP